jgi:hypothetical protein
MGEPALHAPQMNHPLTYTALQHDQIVAISLEANWAPLTIWTGLLANGVNLEGVQSTVFIMDGQNGWVIP